jgi:hypothetical protein
VRTSLHTGNLSCAHLEPLWLEAQSVPSASLVPCVRSPLAGWIVADVAVKNGRSVITLHHDRAGSRAVVVRLAAACDTTGTVDVPSPAPGVRRYQRIDQSTSVFGATWYDRFPGGCVTCRLHSASDLEGYFAAELPALLGFVNRPPAPERGWCMDDCVYSRGRGVEGEPEALQLPGLAPRRCAAAVSGGKMLGERRKQDVPSLVAGAGWLAGQQSMAAFDRFPAVLFEEFG